MLNEETLALAGVPFTSADWVTGLGPAPGVARERNFAVVIEPAGDLAGYFFLESEPPHTSVFSIGAVALAHHGRGVGAAIVEELEHRAREHARKAPPGEAVVWRVGALANEPRVARLLAGHGFEARRVFWVLKPWFCGPPPAAGDVPG